MPTNFQEVLGRRNDLLHRWSIMKEMCDHLGKFTDTDVRKAELGIKSEGEGLIVPQDLIIESREAILADMAEIMIEVQQLGQREVAENDDDEKGKKAAGKGKAKG